MPQNSLIDFRIKTWPQFAKKIRRANKKLLVRATDFENPIFVTGCQRAGTTILTNIFLENSGFVNYRLNDSSDSELDGALILSGYYPHSISPGRYCFQTTYLNERYHEYIEHQGKFKLIFLIRNPYSVVYSICYNWKRRRDVRNFALNELFLACGQNRLKHSEKIRLKIFGTLGVRKIQKACLAYIGKTSQVFELVEKIREDILVIDYDDMVINKEIIIPVIFSFIESPFDNKILNTLNKLSITKKSKLTETQKNYIHQLCWDTYLKAKELTKNPKNKTC